MKVLMDIDQFVHKSEGEWKSMRSGHSLAFQQFEEIISTIRINIVPNNHPEVKSLIDTSGYSNEEICCPFLISWEAESNWESEQKSNSLSGSSVLIPVPQSQKRGKILRSLGYSESIKASSDYEFLDDGTFILNTQYNQTIAEERIWFISNSVRCRSSVLRSRDSLAILQTSHASEVKRIFI